jgi:hypothetical protein
VLPVPAKTPTPDPRPAAPTAVIRGSLRYTRAEWDALPPAAKLVEAGRCFVRLPALADAHEAVHADGPTLACVEFVAVSEAPYACPSCGARFAADRIGGSCPTCDAPLEWTG